ncbi:MAG: glycosyltransferase family 4 protein [Oscillospiraceae bacterium]|nr:glycosyltransferase family 4 protein [Oscillospiraceae bacterium]
MSEKKVLFVASVVKKHINQFHLTYLKWFKDRGYEVHVCARNDFEAGEDCYIPYCDKLFELPFSRSPFSLSNISVYFKLKKIIDEGGYELVHCHTPVAAVISRLASAGQRKKGMKLIYTAHGFHFFKGAPPVSRIYYAVEKCLAPLTDAIITINREDYEAAKRICEKCSCDSYLVHGVGVDTVRIANTSVDFPALRRRLGIPENAFVIMTTVEINRNKNIATALKAFKKVCNSNMYYLVCGSGDMKEHCEKLAAELEISDNVVFAGYRYDVFELLHIADVFLFPSYREGLGIAAIEAMSAGLPVIASDIRGVTEYAVNGKNSMLFPPDDIDGFAGAIKLLYDDKELRERLGAEAAQSVYKFDIRNSVKAMSEIYYKYADIDDGDYPECTENASDYVRVSK